MILKRERYIGVLPVVFLLTSIILFIFSSPIGFSNQDGIALQKRLSTNIKNFQKNFQNKNTCLSENGKTNYEWKENENGLYYHAFFFDSITQQSAQDCLWLSKKPSIVNQYVGESLNHNIFDRTWILGEKGSPVKIGNGITVKVEKQSNTVGLIVIQFMLWASMLLFLIYVIHAIHKRINPKQKNLTWLLLIGVYGLWIIGFRKCFSHTWFGSEDVFYLNTLLPDYFSVSILILLLWHLYNNANKKEGGIIIGFVWIMWVINFFLISEFIEKSMYIEGIKSFSNQGFFSILLLITIGLLTTKLYQASSRLFRNLSTFRLLLMLVGLFIIEVLLRPQLYIAFLPFLLIVVRWVVPSRLPQVHYLVFIVAIGLFSYSLTIENQKESIDERKLLAVQLSESRDFEFELNNKKYRQNIEKRKALISDWFSETPPLPRSLINWRIQRTFFKSGCSDYKVSVLILDTLKQVFYQSEDDLLHILQEPTGICELDSNLTYFTQSKHGCSYMFNQEVTILGRPHTMIFLFKSKKIPEDIGLPTLLISKEAKVLRSAEKYNIAKYVDEELVYQKGEIRYPASRRSMVGKHIKNGFSVKSAPQHNHLVYKTKNNILVITQPNIGPYSTLTHFSISVLVWSIIYLFVNFSTEKTTRQTLFFKIRASTIATVSSAIILFALGSVLYINYEWKNIMVSNLLVNQRSVVNETERALSGYSSSKLIENKASIEMDLQRLAKIYKTEVHFYNLNGGLIASSQPELFYANIQDKEIKKTPYYYLSQKNRGEFIQSEHIGRLNFLSVYSSISNNQDEKMGFINTPYFEYHQDLKKQTNGWLLASLNVFVLLMVLVILLTLTVSKRLIRPLVGLHNWVKNSVLDNTSYINYDGKDEIGDIVKAYNAKLLELNQAMEKIKVNERESAWREMAKQIAHEIKNPLTPMKLSLQQLLKVEHSQNEETKTRIKGILNQIDAMAKMANDFSSFARIDDPIKERLCLNDLIDEVVGLHQFGNIISWDNPTEKHWVEIDKNQWRQVLHNLILNAIQAIENTEFPLIEILLEKKDGKSILKITDNGVGITEENKANIFIPHFTTKSSGSGIGLSVVKQIIEKHDSFIEFQSNAAQTVFTIIISNQY